MNTKAYVLLCALSLFATAPVYAQGQGHHYGKGHTDKGGHDENGSDKEGHNENGSDRDDGNGNDDEDFALLKSQTTEVISELASRTLTTSDGAPIPISVQGKLYLLLTNSATPGATPADTPPTAETVVAVGPGAAIASSDGGGPSASAFHRALSVAGAPAGTNLSSLMESLSGLGLDQRRIPNAVKNFNDFVQKASPEFLTNPPAEFVAIHAVLAQITAGVKSH